MLDDAIGGEQSESESSLSDNLSYAEFLVSHHKKFMDHLQKAFAVSAGSAAAAAASATTGVGAGSSGVLANREDLIDVALAETALDDFNERNNYTASVIFTEIAEDISSKSTGLFHAGNMTNEEYEQFLADLWVGIVLTLMVLSCVCCMCSCLLYHKFQQWKRSVLENRTHSNPEAGDTESLPSYTIASGLPSYEEALEQLKTIKTNSILCSALSNQLTSNTKAQESADGTIAPIHQSQPASINIPNNDTTMSPNQQQTSPVSQSQQSGYSSSASMARLSVVDLFQIYKNTNNSTTDSLSKT